MKLHWATRVESGIANSYGYYVLNTSLLEEVNSFAQVTITSEAEDALLMQAPEFYERLPGYTNWLFTMFEGSLPEDYQRRMEQADYLIAPSNWVAKLFEKYFDKKIFVVPLGVDKKFTFKKRKYPTNKPFRYLWLGAPNPRKGWEEVVYTWKNAGLDRYANDIELYIKTTFPERSRFKGVKKIFNVILDGRNLKQRELVKLYHSSHCFLFPTRGEGFGLTLAEAMATGLPCIATGYSGHTDFFDDSVGYVIGYREGETTIRNPTVKDSPEYKINIVFPDIVEMIRLMLYIKENYREALKKAERGSKRIRGKFTWYNSARTLINIMKEEKNGFN